MLGWVREWGRCEDYPCTFAYVRIPPGTKRCVWSQFGRGYIDLAQMLELAAVLTNQHAPAATRMCVFGAAGLAFGLPYQGPDAEMQTQNTCTWIHIMIPC